MDLQGLPETRRQILLFLKHEGPATSAETARHLGVTREAVRQQMLILEQDGFIRGSADPRPGEPGRPAVRYALTPAGEHLFPKAYDDLAVELIDTMARQLGADTVRQLLASLADARVRAWQSRLDGRSLRERLEILRDYYTAHDPFMDIEEDAQGLRLVERNCPFFNVASRRPALCSVTVSTLSRLLGVRVVREERFQDGHGRCAFRLLVDQPVAPDEPFTLEDDG
ncbi:MAG TPA: helix-turn-helix domain-containing protein [Bacillota bacterium]